MGEIENTFRWSHSRQQNFEECRRRFYLNSYAIWGTPESPLGGWDSRADQFTRLCYRLSKIRNLYIWAGSVVHDQIAGILNSLSLLQNRNDLSTKTFVRETRKHLAAELTKRLRGDYKQSLDELAWVQSPKQNMRLFEHHYGIKVTRQQADELKENSLTCLGNFLSSETFEQICQSDPSAWKPIEKFASFRLNGFEVCLKIDFAMGFGTKLLILDWKTGKPADEHETQMQVYALYATNKWGYSPEDTSVRLVYLREPRFDDRVFSPEELKETANRIRENCHQIQACLRDPEKNIADIDDFPMTKQRWKCRSCAFVEACYRTRDIEEIV